MVLDPKNASDLSKILNVISLCVSGILAPSGGLILAYYTLVRNRDLIFRNSLHNKQIEYICKLRQAMFDLWFGTGFVALDAESLFRSNQSLDEFRDKNPEAWTRYEAFKANCMQIHYALQFPEHYAFPQWISVEKLSDLREMLKNLQPFTFTALNKFEKEKVGNITNLRNAILGKMKIIDDSMKARVR